MGEIATTGQVGTGVSSVTPLSPLRSRRVDLCGPSRTGPGSGSCEADRGVSEGSRTSELAVRAGLLLVGEGVTWTSQPTAPVEGPDLAALLCLGVTGGEPEAPRHRRGRDAALGGAFCEFAKTTVGHPPVRL